MEGEREDIRALRFRIAADPVAFHDFNLAQVRAIRALEDPEIYILVSMMGNGTGKTFVHFGAITAAIMFGTVNPLFSKPWYDPWPYVKDARFCSTAENLKDGGPIQKAMQQLWPQDGSWWQSRGVGKGYYSQGGNERGWTWDSMTYDQSVEQYAGPTKGLIVCSEPPPEHLFPEIIARLRAGGLLIMEMTPLDMAGYLLDMIDEGVFKDDHGNVVGKIKLVEGSIEDNCRDHSPHGQLLHRDIERMKSAWRQHGGKEEEEARASGQPIQLAGRILNNWREDTNAVDELTPYHQECWDKGLFNLFYQLDPHDRKPFAMTWSAIFPNEDEVVVAEWPDETLPRFHQMKDDPITEIDEYRDLILGTEEDIGVSPERRLIDPNFGNAPKVGQKTVKTLFAQPCERCLEAGRGETCPHRLYFVDPPDSLTEGHRLLKRQIGNTDGLRPKLFVLSNCKNTIYAMKRYGWKENKNPSQGTSEKPELIHKDFVDLRRYQRLYGWKYKKPAKAQRYYRLVKRGRGLHAT